MQFTLSSVQVAQLKLRQLHNLRINQIVSNARFTGGWRFGAKMEREALDRDEKLMQLQQAMSSAHYVEQALRGKMEPWTLPHDQIMTKTCHSFGIKL